MGSSNGDALGMAGGTAAGHSGAVKIGVSPCPRNLIRLRRVAPPHSLETVVTDPRIQRSRPFQLLADRQADGMSRSELEQR